MIERGRVARFILKVLEPIFRRAPDMENRTLSVDAPASGENVPPPRRGRHDPALQLNALQVMRILGLMPLAVSVVGFAALSHWRLPSPTHRGRPLVYADASILLIALLARLWRLSSREVCLWLAQWSVLAAACGLPAQRVIDPAHFTRRLKKLGAYPVWVLYLALVWRGLRRGLLAGRDVVVDPSLLAAWGKDVPDADWSFPSSFHVLLDLAARLPLFFLLSLPN